MTKHDLTNESAEALATNFSFSFYTLGAWLTKYEGKPFFEEALGRITAPGSVGDCIMARGDDLRTPIFRTPSPQECVEAAIAGGSLTGGMIPVLRSIENAAIDNGYTPICPTALRLAAKLLINSTHDEDHALCHPDVQEIMDEAVHENCEKLGLADDIASSVNNQGITTQIAFLASHDLREVLIQTRQQIRDAYVGVDFTSHPDEPLSP